RIATRFPFGLFEKSREVPAEGELIIYPAVDPVNLPVMAAGRYAGGDAAFGRGHGDDYLGLKLLRDGEDPRDVHWRKSAAVGQLVARERARDARPDVVLPLDVIRPDDAKDEWFNAFERKIRDVASRAVAHVKRFDAVTIKTTSTDAVRADRSTGADPLLRFLALVESVPMSAAQAALEARSAARANDGPVPPPSRPKPPADPTPAPGVVPPPAEKAAG
ncbi:MAG TPA: DUF58 domain-containing protein, partial [Labilithrix sp.]|nr:DUF58 domain-containing protein [Labilithrix sp.]